MGQRSQIYVRFNNENGRKELVARYFGWNYAERMVSRARWTIEWLKEYTSYDGNHLEKTGKTKAYFNSDGYGLGGYLKRLIKVIETNFDMHDVADTSDIIKEWEECEKEEEDFKESDTFKSYVFTEHDNNNGKLFIELMSDGTIKYAFTDDTANTDRIMDGNTYMYWDKYGKCDESGNWKNEPTEYFTAEAIKTCEENIAALENMATLMTKEELEDFINFDYLSDK